MSDYQEYNGMSSSSLSSCFGPLWFRQSESPEADSKLIKHNSGCGARFLQILIEEPSKYFGPCILVTSSRHSFSDDEFKPKLPPRAQEVKSEYLIKDKELPPISLENISDEDLMQIKDRELPSCDQEEASDGYSIQDEDKELIRLSLDNDSDEDPMQSHNNKLLLRTLEEVTINDIIQIDNKSMPLSALEEIKDTDLMHRINKVSPNIKKYGYYDMNNIGKIKLGAHENLRPLSNKVGDLTVFYEEKAAAIAEEVAMGARVINKNE